MRKFIIKDIQKLLDQKCEPFPDHITLTKPCSGCNGRGLVLNEIGFPIKCKCCK
jgi:hypothetical protein